MAWLLHIKDKILVRRKRREGFHKRLYRRIHGHDEKSIKRVGGSLFCPTHCLPHKLPFGKKICDERCHYHQARWRMWHHTVFCKLIGCSNYKRMISEYKKHVSSL